MRRRSSDHFRIRATASAAIASTLAVAVLAACESGGDTATGADAASATATTRNVSARSANPAPVHGPYAPPIDAADFISRVDNPYLPFKPGTTLRYRGVAENGKTPQTDIEFVTHQTKRILGVDCTVVRDTVASRGKPIERTLDWYAQDRRGNVWYFGEDARDFEHGRFVKASDSWEAGVDGAQPGIIMEAHPKRGDVYRQEYYPGHALDQARVLGASGPVKVPYRSFSTSLATVERSPLEPTVREKKFNVRGIGVIAERVTRGNQERFELASVSR